MKKAQFLMLLTGASLWLTPALAGSGNAVVTLWHANPTTTTNLFITNVTSHTLNIGVTFYTTAGVPTTCPVTVNNLLSGNTQIAGGAQAAVSINCSTNTSGYARILWSNEGADQDTAGLAAIAIRNITFGSAQETTPITVNGGQPF